MKTMTKIKKKKIVISYHMDMYPFHEKNPQLQCLLVKKVNIWTQSVATLTAEIQISIDNEINKNHRQNLYTGI